MDKWFYYVLIPETGEWSPRKSAEMPPIGGEVNKILWSTSINEKESTLQLDTLDRMFRKQAEADLT